MGTNIGTGPMPAAIREEFEVAQVATTKGRRRICRAVRVSENTRKTRRVRPWDDLSSGTKEDDMPGFDGTGPRGMGPMTGGGRGFCSPWGVGRRSYGAGLGRGGRFGGFGGGYGRGYGAYGGLGGGYGRAYPPAWGPAPAWGSYEYGAEQPSGDLSALQDQVRGLQEQLREIDQRMRDLAS